MLSRTLLVVSTVAILGYIGYFTRQHFVDSFGWPFALILLGLTLVALSALAVRIDRRDIAPERTEAGPVHDSATGIRAIGGQNEVGKDAQVRGQSGIGNG